MESLPEHSGPVFNGVCELKLSKRIFNRDSKQIKQYNLFFLRWYWSFNRKFWEKFRPGRLIEQDRDLRVSNYK